MIEIKHYEKMDKGACKAKVSIRVEKWGGFCIHDIALMEKDGKKWIAFPSKKVQVNGQDRWLPYCTFDKSEILKKFAEEIWKIVEAQHI